MPGILIAALIGYAVFMLLVPLVMFVIWPLRVAYLPGYIKVSFTDPGTQVVKTVQMRLKPDVTRIDLSHGSYDLDKDTVRYIGRFRLPYYEFLTGVANPVKISEDGITTYSKRVSSVGFKNVAKNVAMAQLIEAMRKGIINPVSMVIIAAVVTIIAVIALGVYINTEFTTIKEAMGIRPQ